MVGQQNDPQGAFIRTDIYDALGAIVRAIGAKEIGCRLRPNKLGWKKKPQLAAKWVNNCLDRQRRDCFKPEDIEAIFRWGQEAGEHAGKHAFDRMTGYHPSQPMTITERKENLMRTIRENQMAINKALAELGELDGVQK